MATIIDLLRTTAAEVVNGDSDPLHAYILLKHLDNELQSALKIVQPLAIDKATMYNQKSFEFQGARIEVKNAASRWDYSNVTAVRNVQDRLKTLQQLAQNAAAMGGEIYDADGIVIEPAKKIEGATTIAVILNK